MNNNDDGDNNNNNNYNDNNNNNDNNSNNNNNNSNNNDNNNNNINSNNNAGIGNWLVAFFSPDFRNISEIIQKAVYARFLLRKSWRLYLKTTDILLRELKHSQNIYQSINTALGNCS